MDIVLGIVGVIVLLGITNFIITKRRLRRIGNNIKRMLTQGTTGPDLRAYLITEGYISPKDMKRCLEDLLITKSITEGQAMLIAAGE